MPRTLAHCALLIVLPFATLACGGNEGPGGEPIPFDSARALGFARHLADEIGERPAGSEASREAAAYIAEEFSKARFGVFRLEFQFEADPNRPATVRAGAAELEATTAGGSAAGTASGIAVDIGSGDEAQSPGALTGKVAVVQRGGATTFFEKVQAARAGGALAVIIVNNEPGLLTANLGAQADVPVVTMEQGDGRPVVEAARAGAAVSVSVPEPRLVDGTNVVARSRSAHACIYVMTANFDSLQGSPGADHNASGVAVMLELAHQFAVMEEEPAVCFIAFDAAYVRGAGALAYLRTVTQTARPAAVIEVHGVGGEGSLLLDGERLLLGDAENIAEAVDIEARTGGGAALSPATEPFRALGIPVLEVSRTAVVGASEDVSARLEASAVDEAAQIAGGLLIQLSAKALP
jgi:hypothetical protein